MSQRDPHEIRIADHPRAVRQIEQARSWGGIAAFVLVAWMSHRAGVTAFDSGVRALGAGILAWFACWALAVLAWSHIAIAELEAARKDALKRREAASALTADEAAG